MANIIEQTPNTADKTMSLLDSVDQLCETTTRKIDYSSIRGKVIHLFYFNVKEIFFKIRDIIMDSTRIEGVSIRIKYFFFLNILHGILF